VAFPGKHRIFAGLLLVAAASLPALAASGGDRADAARALQMLEAAPEDAALAKDAVQRAKDALSRAEGARGSGDQVHGAMLEALALEWALSGRELARTAKIERELIELQKRTAELETKAVRAQALVEQTVARRGRAEEKLRELEAGVTKHAESTSVPSPKPAAPEAAPKAAP
jgi:hypothetical protein